MKNKSILGNQYTKRSSAWRAIRNYQASNQSDKSIYAVYAISANLFEIDSEKQFD